MIETFKCSESEYSLRALLGTRSHNFKNLDWCKRLYLNRARTLDDLRNPPCNNLKSLKGNRKGQHTIWPLMDTLIRAHIA